MKPKIVQIAVTAGGPNSAFDTVYALCADGSVWSFVLNDDDTVLQEYKWSRLPAIPMQFTPGDAE